MLKFVVVLGLFSATANAEVSTCLGKDRDTNLSAINDVINAYECEVSGSLLDCRNNLAITGALATGGAVGAGVAIRSNMRLGLQQFCKGGVAGGFWQFLTGPVAYAKPRTCNIGAPKLKAALDKSLSDLQSGMQAEIKFREGQLASFRQSAIATEFKQNQIRMLNELEADIKKNPRKYAWDLRSYPSQRELNFAEKKFLAEKSEQIREAINRLAATTNPEEARQFMFDNFENLQKGLPAQDDVARMFNSPPLEIEKALAEAEKLKDPFQKRNAIRALGRQYPALELYVSEYEKLGAERVELSVFNGRVLNAKMAAATSADDVMRIAAQIEMPRSFTGVAVENISRGLSQFRAAMYTHLGPEFGRFFRQAGGVGARLGARSVAAAALVAGSLPVMAADLALHSSNLGCSDAPPIGYDVIYNDDCKVVSPVVSARTIEFLKTHEDDEILAQVAKDPKFCDALLKYQAKSSFRGWKSQCTSTGFKLTSRSEDYAYIFDTDPEGNIIRGRKLGPAKRIINNDYTFEVDSEGHIREVRHSQTGVSRTDSASAEALHNFQQAMLAFSETQNCCFDYANADHDKCSRFGIEKGAPERARTGTPSAQ